MFQHLPLGPSHFAYGFTCILILFSNSALATNLCPYVSESKTDGSSPCLVARNMGKIILKKSLK